MASLLDQLPSLGRSASVSNQKPRLFFESFILLEPLWTLLTGSVPFWMKFNMEPSVNWIEQYLKSTDPYDEIYMMLFSHGTESVGLPSIERWRTVLNRARQRGEFVGVEDPRDFATLIRYHTDLQRRIRARYPLPGALTLEQLDKFIEKAGERFPVRWSDRPLKVQAELH